MSCPNPRDRGSDELVPPAEEDTKAERIVLINVLGHHPTQLTLEDLAQIICEDPEDFAEFDAVDRAAKELKRVGLLHISGAMITPTLASVTFDRLLGDG